jgi:hypothetical protein
MIEVILPWEVDRTSSKYTWAAGYLEQRRVPSIVYLQPKDERLVKQISSVVKWTLGSRNWIVCICNSTGYIRSLFGYVLASYVFTTQGRAISVDVDDLTTAIDEPDGDKRDIIEYADLLLINYCDPDNPHLKWKKGAIANILQRRKYKKLSTVLNVFSRKIPDKMDSAKALKMTERVTDMFGETSYELFTDQDSKRVLIRSNEETRYGRGKGKTSGRN